MINRTLAAAVTAVALAGGSTALVAAPAQADGPEKQRRGTVAGASYEISVEKDRRFEVDADLDGVRSGSQWRMVVRHEGHKVAVRTAGAVRDDGRYEVDFREVHTRDTRGNDRFSVTLERIDGPGKVTRTLVFAR
jgi:hypothetical protein